MRKTILAIITASMTMLSLTSCGIITVDVNEDKLSDITMGTLDKDKIRDAENKVKSLSHQSPEEAFRSLLHGTDVDSALINTSELKQKVCVNADKHTNLSTIVANLMGVPVSQEQTENIILAGVMSFCPEKALAQQ